MEISKTLMQLLNKTKIHTRIIVMVFLPLFVIVWLSIERYNVAKQDKKVLEDLDLVLSYLEASAELLLSLEIERELLFGVTSNQSKDYLPRYDERISKTVELRKNWRRYYEANRDAIRRIESLDLAIKKTEEQLTILASIREEAKKGKNVLSNGLQAGAVYTQTIGHLIESVKQVVLLSTKEENLVLLAESYYALLMVKEYYVLNNAVFLRELSKTSGAISRMSRISVNYGIGKHYGIMVTSHAPPSFVKRFNQEFNKNDDATYVASVKRYLAQRLVHDVEAKIDISPEKWDAVADRQTTALRNLEKDLRSRMRAKIDFLLDKVKQKIAQSLMLVIGLIVGMSIISFLIIRSILRPLRSLVNEFDQIASTKDLTIPIEINGTDELSFAGKSFLSLINRFNDAIKQIHLQTHRLTVITNSVSVAMNESVYRAENQSSATDSVSVAVEEMNCTVREVATIATSALDAVQRVHSLSVDSVKSAGTGCDYIQELIRQLGDIGEAVLTLHKESDEISSVVNVIQDISEQVNLLALNASIEAARAGDHGRGFAIVATEVRELANRTRSSTEKIRQQIESLQKGSNEAVSVMKMLQSQGEAAVSAVNVSVNKITSLEHELETITNISTQIATAAEEQSQVTSEINERIHGIKEDSDKMAFHAKSTMDSTAEMSDTEDQLKEVVSSFKTR